MNGLDWQINSIPLIRPSIDSMISVLGDDTGDVGQETERDTTNKKPTSKKSPVVQPLSKQISLFQAFEHSTSVIGKTVG